MDGSFSNVSLSSNNWINGFFGIMDFYLCCVVNCYEARAEVVLRKGDDHENKLSLTNFMRRKAGLNQHLAQLFNRIVETGKNRQRYLFG